MVIAIGDPSNSLHDEVDVLAIVLGADAPLALAHETICTVEGGGAEACWRCKFGVGVA